MIEIVNPAIESVVSEFRRHAPSAGQNPEHVQAANKYRCALVRQHWKVLNAITIPADLKRNVVLQQVLKQFKATLAPLRAFSLRLADVPLLGTNILSVPYAPLVTDASTDFNPANGYVMGDGTIGAKPVEITRRKYQPVAFSSAEFARQPAMNLAEVIGQKAHKLAFDVIQDVLSVVTLANFGAAAFTGAANTFDADAIADLKGVADVGNWPALGRALIVKSGYDVNLLKDDSIKNALAYGGSEAIRQGKVPIVHGFNYYVTENIPANGQNLVGMISFPSAILVGISPVAPAEGIKVTYETIHDEDSDLVLEYRRWGNPDMDQSREVVEVNYGFAVGEAAALKRMISAAP